MRQLSNIDTLVYTPVVRDGLMNWIVSRVKAPHVKELEFIPSDRQLYMLYAGMLLPTLVVLLLFVMLRSSVLAILTLHLVCFTAVPCMSGAHDDDARCIHVPSV